MDFATDINVVVNIKENSVSYANPSILKWNKQKYNICPFISFHIITMYDCYNCWN